MGLTMQKAGALLVTAPGVALSERTAEMRDQSIPLLVDAQELWLTAPGFPDYEVSSLGRVRRSVRPGNWKPGVLLKPYRRTDGYVLIGLYREKRQQITCYLHRLVCEAFHGPPPDLSYEAAHENGVSHDNRASNLAWKKRLANLADKRRHGTHGEGERHGGAKITEPIVHHIFELRAKGLTLKEIGSMVGVDYTHVSSIVRRESWAHVAIPQALLVAATARDGRRKGGR